MEAPSMEAVLDEREAEQFIGRSAELRALRERIVASNERPQVVCCSGSGGVGKTTLVRRALHEASGHRSYWLRGGTFPPTELRLAQVLEQQGITLAEIGRGEVAEVLIVDALERMSELAEFVFDELLARLGSRLCVIVTSRSPLPLRRAARLQPVLTRLELGPFSPAESRLRLERGAMPPDLYPTVIQLTQGHPLALSLVLASFRQRGSFAAPESVSDVVLAVLSEQLSAEATEPRQRDALALLAILRELDGELLQGALGCDPSQAESLLQWLTGLPFVELGGRQVRLHDRVRAGLHAWLGAADAHRRDLLARKAALALLARAEGASLAAQRALLVEVFHAHRHLPMVRDAMCIEFVRETTFEVAGADAHEAVRQLAEEFLGPTTASEILTWATDLYHRLYVVRGAEKRVVAAAVLSLLEPSTSTTDPVERACLKAETSRTSLRRGDELLCFRVFVSRGGALPNGPDMAALMLSVPLILAQAAGRARSCYFAVVEPEAWLPLTAIFPVDPVPGVAVELDGRRVGLFVTSAPGKVIGWSRRQAHHTMLCFVVERMLDGMAGVPVGPEVRGVERESFPAQLHDALRCLASPPLFEQCQLASDPIFGDPNDAVAGALRLRELILAGFDELGADTDLARALRTTYASRPAKQEAAAAELGIPFGTYRYRLRRAEAELARLLWSRHA